MQLEPYNNGYYVVDRYTNTIDNIPIDIAPGFYTNGGSYSDWLVPLVGPRQSGNSIEGFTVHDAVYSKGTNITKKQGDKILKILLQKNGRPAYKINFTMFGLWIGGKLFYAKAYPQFVTPTGLRYAKPACKGFKHLGRIYNYI